MGRISLLASMILSPQPLASTAVFASRNPTSEVRPSFRSADGDDEPLLEISVDAPFKQVSQACSYLAAVAIALQSEATLKTHITGPALWTSKMGGPARAAPLGHHDGRDNF